MLVHAVGMLLVGLHLLMLHHRDLVLHLHLLVLLDRHLLLLHLHLMQHVIVLRLLSLVGRLMRQRPGRVPLWRAGVLSWRCEFIPFTVLLRGTRCVNWWRQ